MTKTMNHNLDNSPTEILAQIFEIIDSSYRPTLSSLSLVNSDFRVVANRILFRVIKIDVTKPGIKSTSFDNSALIANLGYLQSLTHITETVRHIICKGTKTFGLNYVGYDSSSWAIKDD